MDSTSGGNALLKQLSYFLSALLLSLLLSVGPTTFASAENNSSGLRSSSPATAQINSNSVLVALLDSHYTELAELVEKALLLQTLEDAVGRHNLTLFAPRNDALERDLDPEFKRFLLQPANLRSLQTLLLSHFLPSRLRSAAWPSAAGPSPSLSGDPLLLLRGPGGALRVDTAAVVSPDAVVRPDGVIHGVDRVLIPRSVQEDFNRRRSLRSISAVLPQPAPSLDSSSSIKRKKTGSAADAPGSSKPAGAPPALPIYEAMAPSPGLAPAPAPGPDGPRGHFHGAALVRDFIEALVRYGGYGEMADILVNLTGVAAEMGRLVSEGYVVTVLAPNDEAMARLAAEELAEAGAPERMVYYHMIPEYQTEESMYNAVRRFGRVRYDTLRLPHKLVAEEADGTVKFGEAYLFDPDIYTDGRISVQGIDRVLFPPEKEKKKEEKEETTKAVKVAAKRRRGKLLEVACQMLGAVGQDSLFSTCQ